MHTLHVSNRRSKIVSPYTPRAVPLRFCAPLHTRHHCFQVCTSASLVRFALASFVSSSSCAPQQTTHLTNDRNDYRGERWLAEDRGRKEQPLWCVMQAGCQFVSWRTEIQAKPNWASATDNNSSREVARRGQRATEREQRKPTSNSNSNSN